MLGFLSRWKRKTTAWVRGFAEKPYARTTLFFHSLADSSFFPVTIDITFIPIAIASPKRAYQFALYATIGSILGGILAYIVGYELMETVGWELVKAFNYEEEWPRVMEEFRGEYAEWTLIFASLTPLPYAIATLASGVAKFDFWLFVLISTLGRATRFTLMAFLINKFGEDVQFFLDRYSRPLAVIFFLALGLLIIYLVFFN
jgi:membrane protein YqaA with SNARE-associated domain